MKTLRRILEQDDIVIRTRGSESYYKPVDILHHISKGNKDSPVAFLVDHLDSPAYVINGQVYVDNNDHSELQHTNLIVTKEGVNGADSNR